MPHGVAAVGARIADIQARFASPNATATGSAFAEVLERATAGSGRAGESPAAGGGARVADLADSERTAGTAHGTDVRSDGVVGFAPAVPEEDEQARAGAWWATRLPEEGRPWASMIEGAARMVGIEPELLAAVVQAESGFRPDAVSTAGAIGLAQLMPQTAAGLGVDPHDPEENLLGGARYLRAQLDRFGAVDLALAAYNAGPGRVVDAGGVPRIPETVAYLDRVRVNYLNLR